MGKALSIFIVASHIAALVSPSVAVATDLVWTLHKINKTSRSGNSVEAASNGLCCIGKPSKQRSGCNNNHDKRNRDNATVLPQACCACAPTLLITCGVQSHANARRYIDHLVHVAQEHHCHVSPVSVRVSHVSLQVPPCFSARVSYFSAHMFRACSPFFIRYVVIPNGPKAKEGCCAMDA